MNRREFIVTLVIHVQPFQGCGVVDFSYPTVSPLVIHVQPLQGCSSKLFYCWLFIFFPSLTFGPPCLDKNRDWQEIFQMLFFSLGLYYLTDLMIFLRIGNFKEVNGGMESPSKNPQGFNESMWSKITFTIAVKGIDKNIPGIPHKAPPAITTTIETSALIFTLDPTNFGIM